MVDSLYGQHSLVTNGPYSSCAGFGIVGSGVPYSIPLLVAGKQSELTASAPCLINSAPSNMASEGALNLDGPASELMLSVARDIWDSTVRLRNLSLGG